MEHLGDRVYAYVAGALDEAEQVEADAHLRECPACRREVQEARASAAPFRDLRTVPPGECLNIAALLGLIAGTATASQADKLEEHVMRCSPCRETRARLATYAEKESLEPRGKAHEFVAGILRYLTEAGVPGDRLLSGMNSRDISFRDEVRLSILAPAEAKRLAADTGAAFEACELTSDDGTIETRIEQFGQLLRVRLNVTSDERREGLALAAFEEAGDARMSVPLAVRRGEGFGTLSAEAAGFRKPAQTHYMLRLTFVAADEIVKALVTYGVL